jgi:DNA-binding IclR family transcriptional regulator
MARNADWFEPDGPPARPRLLAPALTILAQFDCEHAVLTHTDISRLTGCSGSIAQRCLVTLSELGYLTEAPDGAYRLGGAESDLTSAACGDDDTFGTAA